MRIISIFIAMLLAILGIAFVYWNTVRLDVSADSEFAVAVTDASTVSKMEIGGIVLLFPTETAPAKVTSTTSSDGSFSYESSTVVVEFNKRNLTVNGRDFGKLKEGDEVDFRVKGKVLVNGEERKAQDP